MAVVARALSVLDVYSDGAQSLRLTTIAERAGLPVPTALRLVRELVAWGGLERQADGSYRLGSRLWTLGNQAPCPRRLVELGRPLLRRLHAETGLSVLLAVLDGARVVVADAVGSGPGAGTELPPHATAAGKIFLAHMPEARRREAFGDLARLTPYTIIAPGILDRQLTAIRAGASASAREERRMGEIETAAPVGPFGANGPAAVLSVTARSTAEARRVTSQVVGAASTLSNQLKVAGRTAT
ncbi:transcriptional regulator [Frankia sp. EI5c]|uniref:IclR family transcriptional regulator n=1 Tax=Frankia sp. EI5c TaxID=683316 RepID=UPI0007C347A3|nr:IclR family transcriptional regulator [Frankia sp. EI5c]OAA23444.1 transcriptional regulator [Frankia sp. EI5c]